ncbi:TetR/AcrR family transcriptional regulator [Planomonospora venezuelensis]|uniref:AcrR family transcriptional regulator n=1 Tax=Planomonospora venezuelensis TaxID=1999 RepID=A0A841DEB4_PLAVE|nr:TetR/AcrR family transcriptional regulator [Planomonospora venezuelensis]MBB5966754.1 AcrR family transcriptional regulator [Planomonospora venezuelensis]GIN01743.1 TetR family transcriptional regulator [Planomonospora venezuelensis]
MATRQDWLDEGLTILAASGAPALTIELLCERLGLTKGSFYHHFRGMPGYRAALLDHFETRCTTELIDLAEADPHAPAAARLERLFDLVGSSGDSPALEVAMRSWAQQDERARAVQERVDRRRTDYLRALWEQHGGEEPETMARLLYLVLIGAGHLVPPLTFAQVREIYDLALRPHLHEKERSR